MDIKREKSIFLIVLLALILRTFYGMCINFSEVNTLYLQDYTQIYLIGLKFYITGIWPFWGPDITYTSSQIPGALQGLLVGLPFYILAIPEAPFLLLNILSTLSLAFFAWYLSKRFAGIPKWFIYVWLLTAPWTLNYSTTVINPSYVLAPAILFFVSVIEILPFYKEKIVPINLSFFMMGFTLGWILQIHMSWVLLPFYILMSFYVLLKTKKRSSILFGILFFSLGFIVIMSTFIPTIIKYGFVTGDTESNIVVNFSNLMNVDILTRFIALSTFEARYFITGGLNEEKALLMNNLWAAPFIIILFFTGISQTIYYIIFFLKKTSHAEFRYVKLFTIGSILLLYLSYLFVVRDVASHTFYVLLPISFWFSFYCLEALFKKLIWKRLAVLFIFSGLIYHITLAKEYFPTNSLSSKKSKIEQALIHKDSRLFAYRRVADREKNEQAKFWKKHKEINLLDTTVTYVNNFDSYTPDILPEALNNKYYISADYSCRIDSAFPFSLGLNRPLRDFDYKRKVSISLFVRYSEINNGVVFLTVRKQGMSLFWEVDKICIEDDNINQWKQMIINKELPVNIDTSAQIGIYVWLPSVDNSPAKIQIDDFKIEFK